MLRALGVDAETVLKLVQILLRVAIYFFAGFALLGLSSYVAFLCMEIFASRPRVKVQVAKVPRLASIAPKAEPHEGPIAEDVPILGEEVIVIPSEGRRAE